MNTRLSRTALAFMACLVASGLVACKKDPLGGDTLPVVSVTVTPGSANVAVGATSALHAQAYAANNVAVGDAVTWASSDTSKATVDASGVVTGIAAGSANITASVGAIHSNAATITVTAAPPHVASITVSLDTASVAIGGTATATATATDQFGAAMQGVAFTWQSSNTAVAKISAAGVATGVTAGTTNISASSGGVTSNAAALTITAVAAQGFELRPGRIKLKVGGQSSLLAVAPSATPTWASSDPAVATVDANGRITAVAKGTATITATAGTTNATSSIRVFQTTGAHPDPTSQDLIARAAAGGMITHEQALEYRVFAQFGDPRLPAEYDGAPGGGADDSLLRQVQAEFPGLSQAAQDILNPFFIAPIYTQSALGASNASKIAHAAIVRGIAGSGVNCNVAAGPSAFRRVSVTTTDHQYTFNVFYFPAGGGPDEHQEALAEQVAAAALEVYDKETTLFARHPVGDGGLPCNGGDSGIDIYITPINNLDLAGQTVSYLHPCSNTPAFIELNLLHPILFSSAVYPYPTNGSSAIKAVVAHEFLHVLQFAMDRHVDCDDYRWFDEATAEWAMDFVEPTFPVDQIGAPGIEDGVPDKVSTRKRRSGTFLAQYLYSGYMRPIEKGEEKNFGYADYLFFEYVARTQTNQAIRQMFDAMADGNTSLQAVGLAVDTQALWPEFAKSLWNDGDNHVLDYWSNHDDYDFGLADVFTDASLDGAPADLKPLEIDQKGEHEHTFTLLDQALEHSASGDYEIPPRSSFYEDLKFTDANAHTVIFSNPIAGDLNNRNMKVWAVRKIGGQWQPPEDWTEEGTKAFCLDEKAERLEQLLVIVSNSDFQSAAESPYRISRRAPMQVATTNVGCWQWVGTIGVVTHSPDGLVIEETAEVNFYPAKSIAAGLPDAGLSQGYLVLGTDATSTAHFSMNGFSTALGCSVAANANQAMIPRPIGPFVDTDGSLIVNFGLPEPMHRAVVGSGITHMTDVRFTYTCPLGSETDTADRDVHWLAFPDPLPTVSADGQHISGTFMTTDEEGEHVSTWDVHALREQ